MFFNSKIKTTLVFVSLVCFIYVLRGGDNSPMGFLARQASRILEERALTAKLCSGISMYETSTSEKNRASKISSALKKIRSGNPLIDFIEGSDASDELAKEYAVPLVAYSAPWIVFFAIGLVGFLGCAINCCCMNFGCCGCLKCCQKPKTTRYLPCFKNSSFVLMTLLVGTSIAGLIFSQDVRVGGQQTVCALGILVDNLLEGVDGGNWLGLNPIIDNMTFLFDNNYITTNAVAVLASYLPAVSLADKTSISGAYTTAQASVTSMQSTNSGKTATRADSSAGSTYTPDYIADLSTHTTKIQTEMDTKETAMIDDGIDDIASGIIKINAVTYLTAVIQPYIMYQLDNAAGSAKNLSISMDDKGDIAKKGVQAVSGGLIGIFGIELVSAVVAIGAIMLVRCGHKCFNKAIFGSCFCLTLLMILGFALAAFLFPLGVVLIEGCEVSEKLQTDPVFYNQVFDKFLNSDNYTQVREILYNCLFEDGDVLTEIDIRKYFTGHQELFDGLESTYTLTGVNGAAVTASVVIPQEQTLVSNYKLGLVSDASATTTDLKKLNKYTNSDSNSCTNIDDTWVLNSQLCASSDGKVFASANAADYNLYSATCLGFDSSSWGYGSSKHDISQRYTSTSFPQPSCGQIDGSNADSTLDSLVDGFATSRNDVNTIFGAVQTSLTSVSNANTNFMAAIKSANDNIDGTNGPRKTVAPVYAKLGDPTTGILPNGNCKWVKASLGTFQDVMCDRFITGVFQATIVIIIASFFALFGSLMLFCLAKKILLDNKKDQEYAKARYTTN